MTLAMNRYIQAFLDRRGLHMDDVAALQSPSASLMHDPYLLKGMGTFVSYLRHIYETRQVIGIVPDYDADGVLSGTLLRVGLDMLGFTQVHMIHPHTKDGYGLNVRRVDELLDAYPATQVLMTTDNGSNAHEGVRYAKDKGLTVLVTDHHLSTRDPEADCSVNPNRSVDDSYPFPSISGTAVVYKVLEAYARRYYPDKLPALDPLLLLVGLSTVADVMPLLDENRYFVVRGLHWLKVYAERVKDGPVTHSHRYMQGLYAWLRTLTTQGLFNYRIDYSSFGFLLGPMLNSPRRMTGSSALGFQLFHGSRDPYVIAESLLALNTERKQLVQRTTYRLFGYLQDKDPLDHMVFAMGVRAGIAGLLASQFEKRYHLPSIAFAVQTSLDGVVEDVEADGEGRLHGSARAPLGFDLHAMLSRIDKANPGLIVSWGGHKEAAGITLKRSAYATFKRLFCEAVRHVLPSDTAVPEPQTGYDFVLLYDTDYVDRLPYTLPLTSHDVRKVSDEETSEMVEAIAFFDTLQPFGQAFPAPRVLVPFSTDDVQTTFMGTEKQHVKFTWGDLSLIQWKAADLLRLRFGARTGPFLLGAYGSLSLNTFRGRTSVQVMIDQLEEMET